MTVKQRFLQLVYPLWIAFTKMMGRNTKVFTNSKNIQPAESIYTLQVPLSNGNTLPLDAYKGKKIMLVNTASNCGYTNQYDELQKLYQQFNNQLEIIAFPANDFKEQEKGSDSDIAQFCKINFGVTFPLAKKSIVIKSNDQNSIFKWLTNKTKNGWNEKAPSWNFSKYLIDEKGVLTHYFDPSVLPLSEAVVKAIGNEK
ncbi:glutathione peroxidase [Niastella koreensis]|uniref:Glutathione peroxidase n=2 Tax=Niastella koreensis TaxID=354356 RepID=G8THJ1_NIAKG|nr:glutathione peroxidase [Niastella koreensis]AEW02837.1 glutathione peroxidase [Niastella koreensis GR20-10]OQP55169.1 glutathione peroxidase [Niastella koreensis]